VVIVVCAAFCSSSVRAVSVIHWINGSNQSGSTVLNAGNTFTTTFRTANDMTATRLSGALGGLFNDNFGGSTPGNNPTYLTTFVGSTVSGTGNGTPGYMGFLDFGSGAASSAQFDFAQPLTSADRILLVDADFSEQYRIEAYALVGAAYVPLGLGGWIYETFSGQTGVTPDSHWPTWDAANGLLTAGSSSFNEELSVLTPDQPVSRLVISKTTGSGASTGFQVIELTGAPGDYNANGVVDAADYVVWRRNANTSNVLANDPLGGTIGAPQYAQWRIHFGQAGSSGESVAATAALPEPVFAAQIFLFFVVVSAWRRRTCVVADGQII
jgi:hypothetical protein